MKTRLKSRKEENFLFPQSRPVKVALTLDKASIQKGLDLIFTDLPSASRRQIPHVKV